MKKTPTNNHTTLDEIATLINKGFSETQKHFDKRFDGLQSEVGGLKDEMREVKEDMAVVKTDIGGLKADITGVKTDIGGLKQEVKGIRDIQQDMLEELNATYADVRYLRTSVSILTRNEAERDATVKNLAARHRP